MQWHFLNNTTHQLTIELDCNKFVIDSIGSGKTTDQEILDIDF